MNTVQKRLEKLGICEESLFFNEPVFILEYKLLKIGDIIRKNDEIFMFQLAGKGKWINIGREYESMGYKRIFGERYKEDIGPIRRELRREVEEGDKAIKLLGILCNTYNKGNIEEFFRKRDIIIEEWLGEENECIIIEGKWAGYKGVIISSDTTGDNTLHEVKIKFTGEVINFWSRGIKKVCNE